MQLNRPYIFTIAGYDPTNGAGLTADVKTFEQHRVYGLSICSGITLQTEDAFLDVRWGKYPVKVIKTRVLPSVDSLNQIVSYLKQNYPSIKIIVDPIFKASEGYQLLDYSSKDLFYNNLKNCYLITPNLEELQWITGEDDAEIAQNCSVYLKGGHNDTQKEVDYLYQGILKTQFVPAKESSFSKHGTGRVLSAAIASNFALGLELKEACEKAKRYLEKNLESNHTLLAYHNA